MGTVVFGDSFLLPFTLVKDKKLSITTCGGATMKGLSKPDNPNRKRIINVLEQRKNIKCMVFSFGQVDLFFSYYYTKYVTFSEFNIEDIIKKYVEFVASLPCDCRKYIFAIYPSPVKDKDIFDGLVIYKILTKQQLDDIDETEKQREATFQVRYKMHQAANKLLGKYCKLHHIHFVNMENELLNKDHTLKAKFYSSVNIYNIHLLWEPLIPIILDKIKYCDLKPTYKEDIHNSLKLYLKKPKWYNKKNDKDI